MEKFIPYQKLSKKEKRKVDAAKRTTWGRINPVTRKPQNSKAYNRKRTQDWKKGLPDPVSFLLDPGRSRNWPHQFASFFSQSGNVPAF